MISSYTDLSTVSENVNSSTSPKLSTIEDYAHAVGYEMKISFAPASH